MADTEAFIKKYAVDRSGTNSLKWDALNERYGDPDLLAMWVADMEFKVPEQVTAALTKRVAHGVYGYSFTPDSYYDAYFSWQKRRHNIDLQKDWLRFDNGVVNSLYGIVNTFTQPDDAVLILTPVYYPFHNAVLDNHRKLVTSELVNQDGHYEIDFADVERKIVTENVKLFIQCSPHNPVGRIWSADELQQILEICKRHNVLVVSDEIHQDIEVGTKKFVSALSVAKGAFQNNLIVVTAPSKTFNVACLLNSHVIIPNPKIRQRYDAGKTRFNETEISVLGQVAAEAAYTYGDKWLDQILQIVRDNYTYLRRELTTKVPGIKIADLEGTYLTWLDLRQVVPAGLTKEFIQEDCHLAVDYGQWFGKRDEGFVRLNLATNPKLVHKAVANIVAGLTKLQADHTSID
ncbi:MalY/PatB family protein [Loigolactobacillus backii]|uniref:cysteine-S-conjugate beta-lyase n=1 Tax=Loigolactobacillus backii TaxID=375175 RepID=A0A192GZJ3_9LACO|nr:MalY/PatB family protein [Loigolactobacillus backii]ANK61458.1 aminotransferase [Loigolactobacillus backii]ANK69343.1 aminotransferase [Loigolactobacillus backii]MDA5387799.1 pyridoxal phosphate-dependent aminotransferase [Loigolactobacillus backii]MDA5390871.1 pyridoxal phosphate-dependent aminotransferase [Loigolactobacillus backii]PIO84208.1 aminotransferase [Loigolactobacillus backii]